MLRHWSTEHPNQLDLHFHTRFFSSFSTCCNSCSSVESRRWRGLGGERISRINISNLPYLSCLVSSWVFVSLQKMSLQADLRDLNCDSMSLGEPILGEVCSSSYSSFIIHSFTYFVHSSSSWHYKSWCKNPISSSLILCFFVEDYHGNDSKTIVESND